MLGAAHLGFRIVLQEHSGAVMRGLCERCVVKVCRGWSAGLRFLPADSLDSPTH